MVLIETSEVGRGASGRHGGFCSPEWAASGKRIEKRIGLKKAKNLFDLSIEGFEMVKKILKPIKEHMASGVMYLSTYNNSNDLRQTRDWMAKHYN